MDKFKKEPKEENFSRCLNYVLFLLNRREYSLKEIENKLKEHIYHPNDIDKVLKHIVEQGYQSDKRFASSFVRNRKNKYGRKKLFIELKQKGIDENLIEDIFFEEQIQDLEEVNFAEQLLLKKYDLETLKKDKEKWFKKDKPKIIRFMLSRGFSFDEFKHLI